MKSRKYLLISALSFTGMLLCGAALLLGGHKTYQNASASSSGDTVASLQSSNQTAEPATSVSQTSTAATPNQNVATTTGKASVAAQATTTPSFKGVQLDPTDREFFQSVRDFLELNGFSDVQINSPYYDSTLILQVFGIFKGYTDGTVGLNQNLSRAQAATILNRTFGLSLYTSTAPAFGDVPAGSTHEKAINALYWAGITNGCTASPRNYCPSNAVTRKQFAVLLAKSLQQYIPARGAAISNPYSDVSSSDSASPYINYMTQLGIMNGCSGSNFCPDQPLSRGQAVTIMARVLYGSELTPNQTL